MEQKICLDTNACIEIINDTEVGKRIVDRIESYPIFITSIAVFELYLRKSNLDKIDYFLNKFTILPFDDICAREGSSIFKELKKEGKSIDIRDIFISSSCIINQCSLLTLNEKHFENIKG